METIYIFETYKTLAIHFIILILTGMSVGLFASWCIKEVKKQHVFTRNQITTLCKFTEIFEKISNNIAQVEKKLNLFVPADYQFQRKLDDMKNSLDDFLREHKKLEIERERQQNTSADPPKQS